MSAKVAPRNADTGDPGPWLSQLQGDGIPGPRAVPEPESIPSVAVTEDSAAPAREAAQDTTPRAGVAAEDMAAHSEVPAPQSAGSSIRAVIGDELRKPVLWCQMGTCVGHYADPDALGEADNRTRAVAAGWREDALGRFCCPLCLQRSPEFRATYPVVPWDKDHAFAMTMLMAVAAGQLRTSDLTLLPQLRSAPRW